MRLTVTLDDELYNEISQLAKLQKKTKSAIINEFLSPAIPAMRNISRVIQYMHNATADEREALQESLQEMADSVTSIAAEADGQVDMFAKAAGLKLVKTPSQ